MSQPNLTAASAINPSVFVVLNTSKNKAVDPASSSAAFIFGVSQEYSQLAPIPGASSAAAGAAGDPVKVYTVGDICQLQSTSSGWTAGDRLTSTTAGVGVTANAGAYIGAVALTTVSGAGLGQVQVVVGKV